MTRIVALIPDLLFGSRVQGRFRPRATRSSWSSGSGGLDERLADADVLVLDLTNEDLDGAALVEALSAEETLTQTHTLGFYSHVDAQMRERAEQAGFDLVVPRSRMAREGAELVGRLVG